MTIVYFDASAYLKLVVEEAGSELAATLWDGCDAAVSSRLAYPEVCAALAAANRAHRLGLEELGLAQAAWEEYWAATRAVELTEAVSHRAGELADGTPCGAPTPSTSPARSRSAALTRSSPPGTTDCAPELSQRACDWLRWRSGTDAGPARRAADDAAAASIVAGAERRSVLAEAAPPGHDRRACTQCASPSPLIAA